MSWSDGGDPTEQEIRRARTVLARAVRPVERETPSPPGSRLGGYEILARLGEGATGFVYRARKPGSHHQVALKVMSNPESATTAELERFRHEAKTASQLDHPNIVRVLDVGDADVRPYFTMRLVEGGTLTDALGRFQGSPLRAAALMAKVARAIGYAHAANVVHRDLKPANILLDEDDEPYVADFGLAKRLDMESITHDSATFVGTVQYMAPEQARGRSDELKPAADIFSLGAIFYELLSGRAPYDGLPLVATLAALTGPEPVTPPRALAPGALRSFKNICLRCLEKDPANRYPTAEDLADDLEKACGGHAIRAPVSPGIRLARWSRRHPRTTGALAALALAAVSLAAVGRAGLVDERRDLDNNGFTATAQASAALYQLHEYASQIEGYAAEPEIIALLTQSLGRTPPELRKRLGPFDAVYVVAPNCRIVSQAPAPAEAVWQRDYCFRDYYQGAHEIYLRGRKGVFLAPTFRSESHGWLQFALSTPVRDYAGGELGVLVATLNASSVFGTVHMEDGEQRGITTGLLAPRGHERDEPAGQAPPAWLTFVVHPGLSLGAEHLLPEPNAAVLRAAFGGAGDPGEQFAMPYVRPYKLAAFHDPIPGFGGEWLAAFAPVGKTGYVVVAETRADGLVHRLRRLATQVASQAFGVGAGLAGLVLVASLVVRARRGSVEVGLAG